MAVFGSNIPSELGLRLLLWPLGSNVVVRTACCSIGIALPVYSTFKAIERKNQDEQHRCLLYWAAYGSFSIAEIFSDRILYCWSPIFLWFVKLFRQWLKFPLYYHMKFAFLVWLQLPTANGAKLLYINYIRPFLLKRQARLDQFVGFFYDEMAKFVSAHQAEFQFTKKVIINIFAAAQQMVTGILHPNLAIGGSPEQAEGSNSSSDSDSQGED